MKNDDSATSEDSTRKLLQTHLNNPVERQRLYRFCYRLTGDSEIAEDITQEALLEAWRQGEHLQKPAHWRSWLHGIAKNMYLRWRRSHAREMARRFDSWGEQAARTHLEAQGDGSFDLHAIVERYEVAQLG
jgi:RNA polymerase sigma factor (sigma-70 family)